MKKLLCLLLTLCLVTACAAALAAPGERRILPQPTPAPDTAASPEETPVPEAGESVETLAVTLAPVTLAFDSDEQTLFPGAELTIYNPADPTAGALWLCMEEPALELLAYGDALYLRGGATGGAWVRVDCAQDTGTIGEAQSLLQKLSEAMAELAARNTIVAGWTDGAALRRTSEGGWHVSLDLAEVPQALVLAMLDAADSEALKDVADGLKVSGADWSSLRQLLLEGATQLNDDIQSDAPIPLEADIREDFSRIDWSVTVAEQRVEGRYQASRSAVNRRARTYALTGALLEGYGTPDQRTAGGFDIRVTDGAEERAALKYHVWDEYMNEMGVLDLRAKRDGLSASLNLFSDGALTLRCLAEVVLAGDARDGRAALTISGANKYGLAEPSALRANVSWRAGEAGIPARPVAAVSLSLAEACQGLLAGYLTTGEITSSGAEATAAAN